MNRNLHLYHLLAAAGQPVPDTNYFARSDNETKLALSVNLSIGLNFIKLKSVPYRFGLNLIQMKTVPYRSRLRKV